MQSFLEKHLKVWLCICLFDRFQRWHFYVGWKKMTKTNITYFTLYCEREFNRIFHIKEYSMNIAELPMASFKSWTLYLFYKNDKNIYILLHLVLWKEPCWVFALPPLATSTCQCGQPPMQCPVHNMCHNTIQYFVRLHKNNRKFDSPSYQTQTSYKRFSVCG